jgi:4'-phosphopantetheinyl transferase
MDRLTQTPFFTQDQPDLPKGVVVELIEFKCQEADWHDLDDHEQKRAANYKFEKARNQFVAGRSALKRSLAKRINCLPKEVRIVVRADGKPELADQKLGIQFNVSHTGDVGLVAIGDRPIGIDIEEVRDVKNAHDLLKRFFTTGEFEQYTQLPDSLKQAAFFRGWTCKEAVLKADGRGMRVIDACEVCFDPRLSARLISFGQSNAHYQLISWQPKLGFWAGLAVEEQ